MGVKVGERGSRTIAPDGHTDRFGETWASDDGFALMTVTGIVRIVVSPGSTFKSPAYSMGYAASWSYLHMFEQWTLVDGPAMEEA